MFLSNFIRQKALFGHYRVLQNVKVPPDRNQARAFDSATGHESRVCASMCCQVCIVFALEPIYYDLVLTVILFLVIFGSQGISFPKSSAKSE